MHFTYFHSPLHWTSDIYHRSAFTLTSNKKATLPKQYAYWQSSQIYTRITAGKALSQQDGSSLPHCANYTPRFEKLINRRHSSDTPLINSILPHYPLSHCPPFAHCGYTHRTPFFRARTGRPHVLAARPSQLRRARKSSTVVVCAYTWPSALVASRLRAGEREFKPIFGGAAMRRYARIPYCCLAGEKRMTMGKSISSCV